jgi:hypothetical protein
MVFITFCHPFKNVMNSGLTPTKNNIARFVSYNISPINYTFRLLKK